jgi:serine protease
MKRFWIVLLATGAGLFGSVSADDVTVKIGPRGPAARTPAPSYRSGEVIVQFRTAASERDVERALREGRVERARAGLTPGRYLVHLSLGDDDVPAAVARFRAMPEVDYAEPNGTVRKSQGTTFKPNDRFYPFQWNLRLLNAERAWGIQKGKNTVAVAVLDTGIAFEDFGIYRKAPDFGDTAFLPGFDFVNNDSHANDDEYHGTHVASTIAEATNNSLGVAGLAFQTALMPVKVLDSVGEGSFFDVADGIDYAVDFQQNGQHPVKVINLSLGGPGGSETLSRAVERAVSRGIVLVAAAGNDNKGSIDFPAALSGVIAVGAVDERKERAPYSNFGKELSVVAPGGDCDRDDDHDGFPDCVFQQMPDPSALDAGRHDIFCYCGLDGTSMATPHVAAAAALLVAQGITEGKAVKAALEQTAEPLGGAAEGGRNDQFGHGLIRPVSALSGLGLNLPAPK